jgi:3-methyladenine DNA glycosylase AlkC
MRRRTHHDERLAQLWLFAECTTAQHRRIASLGTRLRVPHGRTLVRAGSRAAEVLVVLEGTAGCVVKRDQDRPVRPG